MIFTKCRRGNVPLFIEIEELDPTKIEVIKNVELDSIFIAPKIKAIKPMPGGFIGVDLTKPSTDNELFGIAKRGFEVFLSRWAIDLAKNILKGND